MHDEQLKRPHLDVLIAAVLYLVTRDARGGSLVTRRAVATQLRYLARHPSDAVTPLLSEVCIALAREWDRRGCRPPTTQEPEPSVVPSKKIH